ncbi:hypothetical protein MCETRH20_01332 [Methylophilaceae bacterium]
MNKARYTLLLLLLVPLNANLMHAFRLTTASLK